MSYADFALLWSGSIVMLYLVLLRITVIRANLPVRSRESIRRHARTIEGPTVIGALVMSLVLLYSSTQLDAAEFVEVAKYVGAAFRGVLMGMGLLRLMYYWVDRASWFRVGPHRNDTRNDEERSHPQRERKPPS
jgi:hypothetical protein